MDDELKKTLRWINSRAQKIDSILVGVKLKSEEGHTVLAAGTDVPNAMSMLCSLCEAISQSAGMSVQELLTTLGKVIEKVPSELEEVED